MKNPKPPVAVMNLARDQMGQPASGRSYPGQGEGDCVTKYLNDLPRVGAKRHPFLHSVTVLSKLSQATKDGNRPAIDRLLENRRGINFAYNYLVGAAKPTRIKDLRLRRHKDGLLLQPTTPKGEAIVALLVLDDKRQVDRIRKCLHCGTWFYARFKHQKFCNDRAKDCQWSHYHSSDWRKQQNKKHQAAHRERLFGDGSQHHLAKGRGLPLSR
jgi:hypothetical protein